MFIVFSFKTDDSFHLTPSSDLPIFRFPVCPSAQFSKNWLFHRRFPTSGRWLHFCFFLKTLFKPINSSFPFSFNQRVFDASPFVMNDIARCAISWASSGLLLLALSRYFSNWPFTISPFKKVFVRSRFAGWRTCWQVKA